MIIFKTMKVSPNFGSYLWKMVVVTYHGRILHSKMEVTRGRTEGKTLSFLRGLSKMIISVNVVRVNMKYSIKLVLIYQ